MAETANKGDFVEVEYTGKLNDPEIIFDTTDEKTAKEAGLHNPKMKYGPVVVCIGQGQLIQGLDKAAEGKELGKEYETDINPEDAFGKKRGDLMKLVPLSQFKKQGVNPQMGMQLNIDGVVGTVRSISGGRVIIDFNHPLAGKQLHYRFRINKKITDNKEKLMSFINLEMGIKKENISIDLNEDSTLVKIKKEIPKDVSEHFEKKLSEAMPDLKNIRIKGEAGKTGKSSENNA